MTAQPDAGVVIAGGGLAAQRACENLRRLGYDGRVVMVCEEQHAPYDRPPLSKGMLAGEHAEHPPSLRPAPWYTENAIEIVTGCSAAALDAGGRRLELSDGSALRYEHLLIATGSRPRRLPALAPSERVLELRTFEDAIALRDALATAERVAVVGAGLIGMEVASAATALGIEATLIEAAPVPLARALPAQLAEWLCGLHRRAGVAIELGVTVKRIHVGRSRVDLGLGDGRRIGVHAVLVAAGSVAQTAWLAGSGLPCEGPVPVDAGGRTAVPGVFAAGDAACFPDPVSGRCLPTPHWEAAVHQGAAVARAIVGEPSQRQPPPMFWSDQHGVRLQVLGRVEAADRIEFDGAAESDDFVAWLWRGGRLLGAMIAGRPRALPEVRRRLAETADAPLREAA